LEILNTISGSTDFLGVVFAVFGGVIGVAMMIVSTKAYTEGDIGASVGMFLAGFTFVAVSYLAGLDSLQKSPDTIEAIVTDYNEVYERGYEVVEQRGDITVLQKRESEAE
jgi:threonine/homoserine efflux transporter RhtA